MDCPDPLSGLDRLICARWGLAGAHLSWTGFILHCCEPGAARAPCDHVPHEPWALGPVQQGCLLAEATCQVTSPSLTFSSD